MIDLGYRGHGAFATAPRGALLDADCGRKTIDLIDVRAGELLHKLPGVSVHRVKKTALAFGKQKIEGQRAFARATDASDDDEPIAGNLQRKVLQVMLARAMNGYGSV